MVRKEAGKRALIYAADRKQREYMTDSNKKEKRKPDPLRNLVITEIYTTEALINILERKGIVSRNEILEEVKAMKEEVETKAGKK